MLHQTRLLGNFFMRFAYLLRPKGRWLFLFVKMLSYSLFSYFLGVIQKTVHSILSRISEALVTLKLLKLGLQAPFILPKPLAHFPICLTINFKISCALLILLKKKLWSL